jgi:hypothetical protein
MSTTELKHFIDERTAEERQWIAAYLLDELGGIPPLNQTLEELAELARRSADLQAGRERVSQAEAEAHWAALERKGE